MRRNILKILLVAVCIFTGLGVEQEAHAESGIPKYSSLEIAVNFNAAHANTVSTYGFWMQGGSVQIEKPFTHRLGLAADISRLHTGQMPHTTAGLDLMTAVFGPRYSIVSPHGRFKTYGQVMAGPVHGSNSLFPNPNGATTTANGVAVMIGGGMDYRISPRVAVRPFEAGWLRTALSNGTTTVQNSLRLSSGVVVRF
ncbi:porin family protein [Terriglobus albidus]|uniref:porin family protein n=1 Tax=Terriglobus albidus TaxID=1592106 RepID=UPI0021DFE4CC|nr:porin family protein [Terriglobus albidus]